MYTQVLAELQRRASLTSGERDAENKANMKRLQDALPMVKKINPKFVGKA